MSGWRPDDVPDLADRTVVVTGANSGIGLEAARIFARRRATVVFACRSEARGRQALDDVRRDAPDGRVELELVDLASLASVRDFAGRLRARHPRLDVLCNNAGVMAVARRLTGDGFESQIGVNHFGHFALTGFLLEALLAAPLARVVTVTSLMHRRGRMRFQDLDGADRYDKWFAYAQSKLANLLFAYELDRRFRLAGVGVSSLACHPGYAATNLQHVGPAEQGAKLTAAVMHLGAALVAQSAAKGAWPTVYAATAPDARGGDFIGPRGIGKLWGAPCRQRSSRASHDEAAARRLWDVSAARTGVDYAALTRA